MEPHPDPLGALIDRQPPAERWLLRAARAGDPVALAEVHHRLAGETFAEPVPRIGRFRPFTARQRKLVFDVSCPVRTGDVLRLAASGEAVKVVETGDGWVKVKRGLGSKRPAAGSGEFYVVSNAGG